MNIKSIVFSLAVLMSIPVSGQNSVNGQVKKMHIDVYRNAVKAQDFPTAITALNYLLAIEPNKGHYKDSLAYAYYWSSNYAQAIYWSDEVLKSQPDNTAMLEIKAFCLKKTNNMIKAIAIYEDLLKKEFNFSYAFNLCELQYSVKRLYECMATIETIHAHAIPDSLTFNYLGASQQIAQTPVKAAVYNYEGLALYELGDKQAASAAFGKSLEVDSTFTHAKANFLAVSNELQNEVTGVTNQNASKSEIKRED